MALIDGKAIADSLRGEIKAQVDEMRSAHSIVPGLAVVSSLLSSLVGLAPAAPPSAHKLATMSQRPASTLYSPQVIVGNRTDSATYVRMKKKAAAEVGFHSVDIALDESVTQVSARYRMLCRTLAFVSCMD
jgi:5,10-methylene-tetrahydrofolate dehydrogenase/methenyl tetrahydrofolate cyclohydrolase